MNEYQESYEKEISLTELLFYCLKKWRWIVAAMLIVGALAGAYKYRSTVQSNQAKKEAQALAEEDGEKREAEIISNPNIEYYNLAIDNLEREMEGLKSYIDSSVIMQLDPYHLATGNLSFYIDSGEAGETIRNSLISAYEDFVEDGRLAAAMLGGDAAVTESELQYLISFESEDLPVVEDNYELSDGTSSAQIQITDIGRSKPNVFQIRITADSEENCAAYMERAKQAIMEFGAILQEQISAHEVTLLAESQTERIDMGIQSYQNEVLSTYTSTFTQLKTMQTELETVVEEEGETIVIGETVSYENPAREAVKFGVIGLVLGAFLAAFILVVVYLMSGRLQSTESFREEFGMPLLGQITKSPVKKKVFGFVDKGIQHLEEGGYADITYEEQMKIVAANLKAALSREGAVTKVMLAGTIAKEEAEAVRSRLMEELSGVVLSDYERIVFQASALEDLEHFDGIVFLEKKGASYTKLIRKETALAADRGVKILGAVVL